MIGQPMGGTGKGLKRPSAPKQMNMNGPMGGMGMGGMMGQMPSRQPSGGLSLGGPPQKMQGGIPGNMGEAMNGLNGMKGMADMLRNWRGQNNG